MSIPALTRGLTVIDLLLRQQGKACRYTDIKQAVAGIGDASLNRLLRVLMESGYLSRTPDGLYCNGPRLEDWRRLAGHCLDLDAAVRSLVERTAEELQESAAILALRNGCFEILAAQTIRDSIRIAQPGEAFHVESDHAATLAVLSQLPRPEVEALLCSPLSRTSSWDEYAQDLQTFQREGYFADRSRGRPGISRCAVNLPGLGLPAALFICLPTVRLEAEVKRYVAVLQRLAR